MGVENRLFRMPIKMRRILACFLLIAGVMIVLFVPIFGLVGIPVSVVGLLILIRED